MLSIILSVLRKSRPVRVQAALVISYYRSVVIEGTAPGVGRGKELLLSAEDGVHPNPVAHGLAQRVRNRYILASLGGLRIGSHRLRITFVRKQCGSFLSGNGTRRQRLQRVGYFLFHDKYRPLRLRYVSQVRTPQHRVLISVVLLFIPLNVVLVCFYNYE